MKKSTIAQALGIAFLAAAGQAQAVSFTQGDATMDINGTINGFYSYRTVEDAAGNKVNNSGITNGLLPGWINFVFTTKAEGLDIKAHVGLAPGINDSSDNVGLPSSAVPAPGGGGSPFTQTDVRNLYFQFGNADMGTIKFGRDIGLFGQTIILSDMTLLGLGGATNASIPFNTTFGMIGHGYMYTGFQAQITYTTPTMGGFSASAGIFQPKDYLGSGETSTPGIQAVASYDFGMGKVWGGVVHQDIDDGGDATLDTFSASGAELGVKAGFGDFEAVGYLFNGKGLGLSTVGAQFFSPSGENDSQGYLVQGTYKMGKTKVGVNYGENKDDGFTGSNTELKNRGFTVGVYHTLNKYITLVGEWNQEKTSTNGDTTSKTRTLSLGGIIFF